MNWLPIKLITSGFGSLGFAIIFNLNKKYYPFVMLLGVVTYYIFYEVFKFSQSLFLANFVASILLELIIQIFCKFLKAPRIIIFAPAIISLIPGASLYNMMEGFVLNSEYLLYLKELCICILGISAGSSLVSALVMFYKKIKKEKIYEKER